MERDHLSLICALKTHWFHLVFSRFKHLLLWIKHHWFNWNLLPKNAFRLGVPGVYLYAKCDVNVCSKASPAGLLLFSHCYWAKNQKSKPSPLLTFLFINKSMDGCGSWGEANIQSFWEMVILTGRLSKSACDIPFLSITFLQMLFSQTGCLRSISCVILASVYCPKWVVSF